MKQPKSHENSARNRLIYSSSYSGMFQRSSTPSKSKLTSNHLILLLPNCRSIKAFEYSIVYTFKCYRISTEFNHDGRVLEFYERGLKSDEEQFHVSGIIYNRRNSIEWGRIFNIYVPTSSQAGAVSVYPNHLVRSWINQLETRSTIYDQQIDIIEAEVDFREKNRPRRH